MRITVGSVVASKMTHAGVGTGELPSGSLSRFETEGGESMLPKVHCGQSGFTSLPGFGGSFAT